MAKALVRSVVRNVRRAAPPKDSGMPIKRRFRVLMLCQCLFHVCSGDFVRCKSVF